MGALMTVSIDNNLTAKEVVLLRKLNGWDYDESEWSVCLKQNLLNVSARDNDGYVVGVGFLCGNQRHAELVDLVVHPEHRRGGIGREIAQLIINYALKENIRYLSLTYDTKAP